MSKFNVLKVKEVRKETPNAVSILFDVPQALTERYRFNSGQYLNIKYNNNGKEVRRAYSICSTPKSGELRIAVKKVEDGLFSSYAHSTLRAGDALEVQIPEGRFVLEPDSSAKNNYVAFAAGSGITPVISILKTVLEEEPGSSFVLLYGNKTIEETIFHEELHALQQQYLNRFFVYFVYSQAREAESLFGRIEKAAVNFILNNKHKETAFDHYFICGPENMIDTVSDILKERHVEEDRISFEIFTPNEDGNNPINTQGGSAKVTVLVDDDETSFTMSKKEILLDAILKEGIDAPYSCQGGICSSCMCRIVKGSAEMKRNSILTDDEIEEGLILSCQAIVTSDEIYVDYDDI